LWKIEGKKGNYLTCVQGGRELNVGSSDFGTRIVPFPGKNPHPSAKGALGWGTRRSDGVPGVRMGDPALLRVTDQRGAEISAEACQEGWEGVFVVSG